MILDNVPWTWNCFLVTMTPHQIQVDLGLHSILTNLAATQPAWDSSLCPTARWSKRKMYPLKCSQCISSLNQIVVVKLICFHFLGSRSVRLKLVKNTSTFSMKKNTFTFMINKNTFTMNKNTFTFSAPTSSVGRKAVRRERLQPRKLLKRLPLLRRLQNPSKVYFDVYSDTI